MSTMPEAEVFVTLGIDTHKHTHVAVALDQLGRRLDQLEIPTTTAGFAELYAWASGLGTIDTVGIEGTGAYGAGLCRSLRDRGLVVVEVERPDRKLRRNAGKSDPIDAEAAARKVLSGEATVTPKSGAGNVEMIRVLRMARRSAVVSRSQVTNQLHALTVTAPPGLREQLEGRTTRKRVAIAAKFRPGDEPDTVTAATRYAMKKLARRFRTLDAEINDLDRQLTRLVTTTAPKVVALRGVGIHTTATLLVTAGDNPERLRSEGAFARLTGTAPIPASSGQTDRFRLSRGGDRQANAALHLIAVNRLLCDPRSKAYVQKRTGGTKANLDILRRLKRYTARELYPLIVEALNDFVATVAVMRSGIEATLFRVSGTKAAALRKFYRQHTKTDRIDARVLARMPLVDDGLHEFQLPAAGELALKRLVTLRHRLVGESVRVADRIRSTLHWAAPGMLSGRETVTDGFVQILMRWPDLQALARARPSTIAKVGQMSEDRAERIRDAAVNTVEFYEGLVDFTSLAVSRGAAHSSEDAPVTRRLDIVSGRHVRLRSSQARDQWSTRPAAAFSTSIRMRVCGSLANAGDASREDQTLARR
jgi:transposase